MFIKAVQGVAEEDGESLGEPRDVGELVTKKDHQNRNRQQEQKQQYQVPTLDRCDYGLSPPNFALIWVYLALS